MNASLKEHDWGRPRTSELRRRLTTTISTTAHAYLKRRLRTVNDYQRRLNLKRRLRTTRDAWIVDFRRKTLKRRLNDQRQLNWKCNRGRLNRTWDDQGLPWTTEMHFFRPICLLFDFFSDFSATQSWEVTIGPLEKLPRESKHKKISETRFLKKKCKKNQCIKKISSYWFFLHTEYTFFHKGPPLQNLFAGYIIRRLCNSQVSRYLL